MPVYQITSPEGKKYRITAPDGASKEEALAYFQQNYKVAEQSKPEDSLDDTIKQGAKDLVGGAVRGVGSIGSSFMWPLDKLGLTGRTNDERRAAIDEGLTSLVGSDPKNATYKVGKFLGEVGATAPVGGALAEGLGALGSLSPELLTAIKTAGMAGGKLGTRTLGGAITGGATAMAVKPEDAIYGLGVGALMPFGIDLAKAGANKTGDIISSVISPLTPERNAVRQIRSELVNNFPTQAPSILEKMPAGFIGPPLPKFGRVAGAKATAGMVTDDPAILKLEMNARNRNPEHFFKRDAENTAAVYKALESSALSDKKANALQDALNARTGPMREQAFEAARVNPTYREELQNYLNTMANKPGIRNTQSMPLIDRGRDALIMAPKNSQAAIEAVGKEIKDARPGWFNSPIDYQKDNLLTAITKLGGINKDMAQATYGNKMWEDVDLGLNTFRNKGGHSLDDMATMLAEHGYLPEGSGVYELVEKLYGNPKEAFSHGKGGFDDFYGAQSAQDQLHAQLGDLISALNRKHEPRAAVEMVPTAQPEDIYAWRKELGDRLNAKPNLVPDKMDNALKANRRLAVDMRSAIDDTLNDASGGLWSPYLQAYEQGMKPITQGRAIQDILDRFDTTKKIFGTDIPQITPAALRRAADQETYINLGKQGWQSKLDAATRAKLDDSIKLMNAIEQARGGAIAINGSPTAPFLTSLLKNMGNNSNPFYKYYGLLDAIGKTRGQQALDEALLNPGQLQGLLDKLNAPPVLPPDMAGLLSPIPYKLLPVIGAEAGN